MPCVWSTARPVIRDYLDNVIALEAIQNLEASELNELYDMLDWEPVAVTHEDEIRDKKTLLAWIVRNMPRLKNDRRTETAALLKQSMRLRGVDISTPAPSRASSVSFMLDRRTSRMTTSSPSPPQPSPTDATLAPQKVAAASDRAGSAPRPVLGSPVRIMPARRAKTSMPFIEDEDMDEEGEIFPSEHASPANVIPGYHLTGPPQPHHGVALAMPSESQAHAAALTSPSFYPNLRKGLQTIERASKDGNHATVLETLGELLGSVWISKKVADMEVDLEAGSGDAASVRMTHY